MKASVLIPYYANRYEQFQRTLWLLERQTYSDYDVWIIDDGGDAVDAPELKLNDNFFYVRLRERGTKPRSLNMPWRYGYKHCDGDFIILATPEVMPPLDAIEKLVNHPKKHRRPVPTMYHIDYPLYKVMDKFPWKLSLDVFPRVWIGFWAIETPWGYQNIHAHKYHHNTNYCGQTREWWEQFGFLPKTEEYMMDEPWLHMKELERRTPSYPADFAVYHQWHKRGDKQYSARIQRIRDQ